MSEVTVKIGDSDVRFGRLGRKFRLKAAKMIRDDRHVAFGKAIADLPADPVAVASRTNAAIDSYMSNVVIEDNEINYWLTTPEGVYFSFKESYSALTPDGSEERIDELHDLCDEETLGKLRNFWGPALVGSYFGDVSSAIEARCLAQFGLTEESLKEFEEWKSSRQEKPQEEEKPAESD